MRVSRTAQAEADALEIALTIGEDSLKPSTLSIALRLPAHTLEGIKSAANKRDVPYQSLMKVWLQEKLEDA